MKFLLIEPSHYRRLCGGHAVTGLGLPPVGLAYIAAILKKYGDVRFLEVSYSSLEEIRQVLAGTFDYILFSTTSFNYLDACAIARDFGLSQRSRLMIGGPHAAIEGADIFSSGPWHNAVIGEGERVCERFFGGESPDTIPGLRVRGSDAFLPPERITDLDAIARPDYSAFPMDRYQYHVILSSRGCPFTCSFCSIKHIWGRHWYYRTVGQVVDEMAQIRRDYGDKVFHINDDNFTLKPDRVEEFTSLLLKKKERFRYVAQGVRADKVNRRILKLMRRSGCERISIGVESGDPAVLKAIGKQETVEQICKAIWMARDAGIEVLSMFVIGTATETLASIANSFEFVRRNTLYPVDFYQLIPYPGTTEWDAIKKNGTMLISDYRQYDHYSPEPVFETPRFTVQDRRDALAAAQKLAGEMERKWYVRKHLRFLLPTVLFRHSIHDIVHEIGFWMSVPFRIARRLIRRIRRKQI